VGPWAVGVRVCRKIRRRGEYNLPDDPAVGCLNDTERPNRAKPTRILFHRFQRPVLCRPRFILGPLPVYDGRYTRYGRDGFRGTIRSLIRWPNEVARQRNWRTFGDGYAAINNSSYKIRRTQPPDSRFAAEFLPDAR